MECAQEENLDETCHNEEDFLTEQDLLTPRIESLARKELTNSTSPVVAQATSAESCQLKTTLAKSVSKVLGETKEVKTLDSMGIKLKSNLARKEDYEAALTIVQTKVLQSIQLSSSSLRSGNRISSWSIMSALSQILKTYALIDKGVTSTRL